MEYLHAYWRMPYIERPKSDAKFDNLFSELPKMSDKEAFILFRRQTCYCCLNKYPYNAGHLLIVPYTAVTSLDELDAESQTDFWLGILQAQALLKSGVKPDGFNIGFNIGSAAGAGIPKHLHAHIVPRWNGDTNFMPVLAQTRVLPTALEALWEHLRSFIQ